MNQPTTEIKLDTRKPILSKAGKYSVKLRVTFRTGNRYSQVYYPLGIYLSEKEFKQVVHSPKNDEQREYQNQIQLVKQRAYKVAQLAASITQKGFEGIYFSASANNTLDSHFQRKVDYLNKKGRVGSADAYLWAMRSFQGFRPNAIWSDVDDEWLQDYEEHMIEHKKSVTTIGMYLRCLRALFNEAITNGEVLPDLYPFRRYKIKTESKIKIPVDDAAVEKIKAYAGQYQRGVDFWKLQYFLNGLNINDLLLLRKENIQNGMISFRRNKTKRTNTRVRDIIISIRPEVQAIIDRYAGDGELLFPYVEGISDARERNTVIKNFTRSIAQELKHVKRQLGISKLTNSIARHTFANKLLNAGVSKEFLQGALGHTSMQTTENYLSGFNIDQIKKASELL